MTDSVLTLNFDCHDPRQHLYIAPLKTAEITQVEFEFIDMSGASKKEAISAGSKLTEEDRKLINFKDLKNISRPNEFTHVLLEFNGNVAPIMPAKSSTIGLLLWLRPSEFMRLCEQDGLTLEIGSGPDYPTSYNGLAHDVFTYTPLKPKVIATTQNNEVTDFVFEIPLPKGSRFAHGTNYSLYFGGDNCVDLEPDTTTLGLCKASLNCKTYRDQLKNFLHPKGSEDKLDFEVEIKSPPQKSVHFGRKVAPLVYLLKHEKAQLGLSTQSIFRLDKNANNSTWYVVRQGDTSFDISWNEQLPSEDLRIRIAYSSTTETVEFYRVGGEINKSFVLHRAPQSTGAVSYTGKKSVYFI